MMNVFECKHIKWRFSTLQLIITILFIYGFYHLYKYFRKRYVFQNSERLIYLQRMNQRYLNNIFTYNDHIHQIYYFDTKPKYDNINNRKKVFDEYLYLRKNEFLEKERKIKKNLQYKQLYVNAVERMYNIPQIKWFKRYEQKTILNHLIEIPTTFSLQFDWRYTSPKGRNRYNQTKNLSIDSIINHLNDIQKDSIEKSEYEIFRDAERAKMTAGLRYDILKRDNFMCQYCGATSTTHGVTLHVDHIVPVAKYGKTEKSNLQTLCRDCNLGKGTKE